MGQNVKVAVIGGGASGVFAAICAAESSPQAQVDIFEKSQSPLAKVRISGGGRCNVTHACFDPRELVEHYPRGGQELLGPFHKFCTGDTMAWFEDRGVSLTIEADNRVFPLSNSSETIVDCLLDFAQRAGVTLSTKSGLKALVSAPGGGFSLTLESDEVVHYDNVLMAAGSSKRMWAILDKMGHRIIKPVPSLFTFQLRDPRIKDLAGISLSHIRLTIPVAGLETEGPLLITHVGLSGPAVLKLSAFGARWMAEADHRFSLFIDWLPQFTQESLLEELNAYRKLPQTNRKRVASNALFGLPMRLWKAFCNHAKVPPTANWSDLSKPMIRRLVGTLSESEFKVVGKNTFKEEFVTAGGLSLSEVDFRSMESRLVPGLFFAGEILDIDAVTGGFNFQAAWTTGWLAGHAIVDMPVTRS